MELLDYLYAEIQNVIKTGVFGINFYDFFILIIALFIAIFIREIFAKLIVQKIKKIVKKTSNSIDDNLFDTFIPPLKLLPIVVVFLTLTLYSDFQSTIGIYLQKINNTLATIFIFWLFHQAIIPFSVLFSKLESILTKALANWIFRSLKYLIIFLGIVAVLEVWGIKIGPIIAGLGLFGVAVALGAQDLFKNLISGIMILLEKRFQIGDVINVPGHTEGSVEHIGFRSTLIRKFDSTPITIPNYIFAEAPILNYTNRTNRRISWTIGLEYSSKINQINELTKNLLNYISQSNDFIVNENFKCHVKIDKFNDSSIDILVYCFTNTNDWEIYLKIKEKLAIEIKTQVENLGLNFAFPSSSIYIEKN